MLSNWKTLGHFSLDDERLEEEDPVDGELAD